MPESGSQNEPGPEGFQEFLEYMGRLVESTPKLKRPEGFDEFLEHMRALAGAPDPVGEQLQEAANR